MIFCFNITANDSKNLARSKAIDIIIIDTMLTADRLKHSLGVARRCQEIAREQGLGLSDKRYFTLGLLHDIGYEFSDNEGHAEMSADMISEIAVCGLSEELKAIKDHGKPIPFKEQSNSLRILNQADMETSPTGERVTATQRLEDIAQRHGKDSKAYKTSLFLCQELKLI